MLRNFTVTGAVLAIVIASVPAASAQTSSSPSTPAPGALSSGASTGSASFLTRQTGDQMLVSDLMDMSVYGPDGQSIGEINDVLLDRMGNVVAVVIGVGGFLGIGEKDVAVPYQSLQMSRTGTNVDRVVLSSSRNDLANAPAFVAADRSTTGTGGGSTTRGATTPGTTAPAR